MQKCLVSLLAGSLLMVASIACGEAAIYVYVDDAGTAHFTDAPTKPYFRPLPAFGLPRGVNLVHGQYADLINRAASEEGIDPALVKAIIKAESNFAQYAVSRKGARGLMQLMPAMAGRYAVSNAFDPEDNVRGGVRYLRSLQDLFPGHLTLALAAYNAGENAVFRYNGIPPYPETRQYVSRVLRYYGRRDLAPSWTAASVARPATRTETSQSVVSIPGIFRRVESDGTPHYTNIPPLVRSPERPTP